ncbi:G5 domain-containing protein [Alicyclobacillus tolerans]|uniref:3D domain-containing protein n=1 Tax=Alicyclobacillus tolerans TaxID=90970 RepID=UPI001EFF968E|nr:3D domain-containing protein [Alicyclobacillus tolerans]MCF8563549.1 G5 domain-containing protein [Alicyclobacillus tolerans]
MRIPKSRTLYLSAAVLALFTSSIATANAAHKTVTVQDNGQRRRIGGFKLGMLNSFPEQESTSIPARSHANPEFDSAVQNSMSVVHRKPARVNVYMGGKSEGQVLTYASDVGQLFQEAGLKIGSGDKVNVPLTAPVYDGETIRIQHTVTRVSSKTEEIPFQTIRRPSSTLYSGETRLLTHGVKGLVNLQTTRVYVDGQKVDETLSQKVVRQPRNAVVLVGTAPRPYPLSGRSGGSMLVLQKLTVLATAYVKGGLTATGWKAVPGVIAVDPSVIPLGTKLYVPGIGILRAEDTGSAIRGYHVDICMSTESQARAWGARTMAVYIVK